jgi:hypothetical protein
VAAWLCALRILCGELLAVQDFRRERVGVLSGGTRQKLNLTIALIHDPDVLLLDEPYQGFDGETYLRFWDWRDACANGPLGARHLAPGLRRRPAGRTAPPRRGRAVRGEDRGRPLMRYAMAARMALIEHLRNRLAMWLIVLYVPIWITLAASVIADAPVRFLLRAIGEVLPANGNHLTQISGGLNAVTQIVGFMMFAVTFKSGAFDRRLAMAGFPRATSSRPRPVRSCWRLR